MGIIKLINGVVALASGFIALISTAAQWLRDKRLRKEGRRAALLDHYREKEKHWNDSIKIRLRRKSPKLDDKLDRM